MKCKKKKRIFFKNEKGMHELWENFSSVQFSRSVASDSLRPHEPHAARQASLSITNSWSSPKLMSTESVMPSNHLIFCRPLFLPPSIFPSIRVFSNESVLHLGGQSIGVSASTSVLPVHIQDWFPLGWTVWISVQSKGYSNIACKKWSAVCRA